MTRNSMGTDIGLILLPTAVWVMTHVWLHNPQPYGEWHTCESVTHSSMGTDTRVILWLTTVWGLTHVSDDDPQQYGEWHTCDSVTHINMGTDTRVRWWPTVVWGMTHVPFCDPHQYGDWHMCDSVTHSTMGNHTKWQQHYRNGIRWLHAILSLCFELPSHNCRSTSTRPCGFCSKPKQLCHKQQTVITGALSATTFQVSHVHSCSHIYAYHVTMVEDIRCV
jgi:hypothetical protein